MDTEYLSTDAGAKGQQVEDLGAISPDVHIAILFDALLVEAVYLGDWSALVIAANKDNTLGEAAL